MEYTSPVDVPRPVAVSMGRTLGISPIVYLSASNAGSTMSVWDHLDVLAESAAAFGYVGATPARLAEILLEHLSFRNADLVLVALVPDPMSHVAAPPGFNWFVHLEPFTPALVDGPGAHDDITHREPLRLGFSRCYRNHRDPSSRWMLWDDLQLDLVDRQAREQGMDALIVLNGEGRVASVGSWTVLLDIGDRFVTPPLSEGALDTPWRRHVLYSGEATESPLKVDSLTSDENVVVLSPWGDQRPAVIVEAPVVTESSQVTC